jgi:UDP-glucose 4-epimerase
MKIVVTGAAGWLGRYVADILGADHDLVLLDRVDPAEATIFDPSSPTGRSVAPLAPTWPYQQVDIADPDALRDAFADADVVVHLAAWPTGTWDLAASTLKTNIMGTINVYEAARDAGVRRVVSASSINAYGTFYWRTSGRTPVRTSLPLTEAVPVEPEDPYSLSKAAGEMIGQTYHRAFGIEVVNLRFAGVWAEVTYEKAMTNGLPVTTAWADDLFQWVHVVDVTTGIALAATAPAVAPEPIVLGAADTRAPEPTLELIQRFKPDLAASLVEPLPGRAPLLSIARARTQLGYAPRFRLDAR